MQDPIVDKICQIMESVNRNAEAARQEIESLERSDLFAWLSCQDHSIRYHLALDLDIPLQHLNHTCQTMRRLACLPILLAVDPSLG